MLLWISWCTLYGVILFSGMLVVGLLGGQIALLAQLFKSSNCVAKFLFVLFLILFPIMMPFSGLGLWVILIKEAGGKHFLHPAAGGTAFPIFKCCC